MVGAREAGEAGEVIVVTVGLEDPVDLVCRNPQRIEGVRDAGPRVDEVEASLVAEQARHAGRRIQPSPSPVWITEKNSRWIVRGGSWYGGGYTSPGARARSTSIVSAARLNV